MSSQIIDHSHEDDVMSEAENIVLEAEFKVLTESNEECALPSSGVTILFQNWSHQ